MRWEEKHGRMGLRTQKGKCPRRERESFAGAC